MLLDIQPQPEDAVVEVRSGRRSVEMGHLDESAFIDDIHAARRTLSSAIDRGLFLFEGQREFDFLYHFDTASEWTSYLEAHSFGDPDSDRPLIEATREHVSRHGGEIVIREPVRAARLRRMG